MTMEHPDSGIDPHNGRKVKRSNTLFGWNTIYGRAGEHDTPYMTRAWLKQLRLHIFHRGDADPDCHDHPWDFWTFPLTSYVEEVVEWVPGAPDTMQGGFQTRQQIVPAFRWSFRPATHCHRVLGALDRRFGIIEMSRDRLGYYPDQLRTIPGKKIITIVWRSGEERKWGFLKHRDGRWCWIHWKDYVFGGGKDGPCQ